MAAILHYICEDIENDRWIRHLNNWKNNMLKDTEYHKIKCMCEVQDYNWRLETPFIPCYEFWIEDCGVIDSLNVPCNNNDIKKFINDAYEYIKKEKICKKLGVDINFATGDYYVDLVHRIQIGDEDCECEDCKNSCECDCLTCRNDSDSD